MLEAGVAALRGHRNVLRADGLNQRAKPHIEPEVHDVSVLNDVLFALHADLSDGLQGGLRPRDFEPLDAVHLGANEAVLDIAVYFSRRLSARRCLCGWSTHGIRLRRR